MGSHTLTLEVSNGILTAKDDMILTINNSAPHSAPSGAGVFEFGSAVVLKGQVSDYDGDLLTYVWREGETVLFFGEIDSPPENTQVSLPEFTITNLGLGQHTLTLDVKDPVNRTVSADIQIQVVDTIAPRLAPTPDKTILWPPDHQMSEVTITANATDNSGLPVTLSAEMVSNEPQEGRGDGDMSPDGTEPVIDPDTGIITLELRAERSGKGSGRTYVVRVTATDASGNASATDVQILVPHDRRK